MEKWPDLDPQQEIIFQVFAIYWSPLDFPGKYVVRRWYVVPGNPDPVPDVVPRLTGSIDEARMMVPPGLTRIERQELDDPVLVETWV